ncbi:hypothetical protein OQA88_9405 [Cercophora sp. LCS_1]
MSSPTTQQDTTFWTLHTLPALRSLLFQTSYPPSTIASHLALLQSHIIPSLGPSHPRHFRPCPVYDGSPFEPSLNHTDRLPSTIRFTIEAVGPNAGLPSDPFNQDATIALLRSLPFELDLTLFNALSSVLFFTPEEAAAQVTAIPDGTPKSQAWIAFDLLRDGGVLVKVYLMPVLKMLATGRGSEELAFEGIGDVGGYERGVSILGEFLRRDGAKEVVEMVGVDCVRAGRVKAYLRTGVRTLEAAREVLTLGGRVEARGLEELKGFPHHDFDKNGGTHTFISFAWSEKAGVYTTFYYSPKVYGEEGRQDIWKGYDDMWQKQWESDMK